MSLKVVGALLLVGATYKGFADLAIARQAQVDIQKRAEMECTARYEEERRKERADVCGRLVVSASRLVVHKGKPLFDTMEVNYTEVFYTYVGALNRTPVLSPALNMRIVALRTKGTPKIETEALSDGVFKLREACDGWVNPKPSPSAAPLP